MIPVAIFSFLVGAVLAWGFRVWIIVPITLLAAIAAVIVELMHDGSFASAMGHVLVIGVLPQLGYGFGLFARHTLALLQAPLAKRSRSTSVALLFRRRSSSN